MFHPHLQVVPVGTTVEFPNSDPFFHNVFSLFNGKRFDLGLYEAGSSKSVIFEHEGVSYIFCNIHPEMSAVIISLNTPLFAIADAKGSFTIQGVPPGVYRSHLWVEGSSPKEIEGASELVHVSTAPVDLGILEIGQFSTQIHHANKFGQAYPSEPHKQY